MNMPMSTKAKSKPEAQGGLVPIEDLARRCGHSGKAFGTINIDQALKVLAGYGLRTADVKQDWAGRLCASAAVAARTVNAYEKHRADEAKAREKAAALEREKRETMFAGGYRLPEDARGPAMTGLTYAEFRAEEARRNGSPKYPPGRTGVGPEAETYASPEEASAARQKQLDGMNAETKARARAATPPRRRPTG